MARSPRKKVRQVTSFDELRSIVEKYRPLAADLSATDFHRRLQEAGVSRYSAFILLRDLSGSILRSVSRFTTVRRRSESERARFAENVLRDNGFLSEVQLPW